MVSSAPFRISRISACLTKKYRGVFTWKESVADNAFVAGVLPAVQNAKKEAEAALSRKRTHIETGVALFSQSAKTGLSSKP